MGKGQTLVCQAQANYEWCEQHGSIWPSEALFCNKLTELDTVSIVDAPTAEYPLGSECPIHKRVHGCWYVCVLK